MTVILDIVFALSESIPKLDGLVTGARDNLPVISTEADRQNIGGVADKATSGVASVQVPEAKSMVPRSGESELAVGGDDNVGNEVTVAPQDFLWIAVVAFLPRKPPHNHSLVYRKMCIKLTAHRLVGAAHLLRH